jgi:hypothetical protein
MIRWVLRLGGIGVSAWFEAALGANVVLAPAAAGAAEAPAVYDDGHADAPAGTPQLGALLRHYVARPPWQVAGIDYAVGVPSGLALRDPLTIAAPGTAIDTAHHLIRVTGNNVTLDGYDFSRHGGWGVYIQSGARDTTITHSYFRVGANGVVPISAEAGASGLTVTDCTIDGGAGGVRGGSDAVWALINDNGSGPFVAKHDLLANAPADAIDFSNGRISAVVEYNAAVSLGHAAGSHPDFVQFVGNEASDSVIAFNTIYQPPGDGEVSGMEGIQIAAQTGAHASTILRTLVANNTIIAPGPELTMSCAIAIIEGKGNLIDGVVVRDNYLDFRGTYYAFYPPSGTNVVFSGNVDMRTGRRLAAPRRRRQGP